MIGKMDKKKKIAMVAGGVALSSVIFFSSFFTTVHSGEVGVKVRFGKASQNPVSEGIAFRVPFIEKIVKMNIKVQKSQVDTSSSSKDLQEVDMAIAVNYNVLKENAVELYTSIGLDYAQVVLQPAIEESVKDVTSRYTAEQLITMRSEVSKECKEKLSSKVSRYGIEIIDFNIINFSFSDEFDRAIERKQVAAQEVLTKQQELEIQKIEAEKITVTAEAQKKANELLQESLTDEILMEHFIEKWDGKMPEYYGGDLGITKVLTK